MIELQGGDARVVDDTKRLLQARQTSQLLSPTSGVISAMQCEHIGTACVILGAGVSAKKIPSILQWALFCTKKLENGWKPRSRLRRVYYNSEARADAARQLIAEVSDYGCCASTKRPLIHQSHQ